MSEPIKLLAVPNIVYTLSPANVSLLQQGMSCTNISVSSPLTRQVMHVAVTVLRTGSSSGTRGKIQHLLSTVFVELCQVKVSSQMYLVHTFSFRTAFLKHLKTVILYSKPSFPEPWSVSNECHRSCYGGMSSALCMEMLCSPIVEQQNKVKESDL